MLKVNQLVGFGRRRPGPIRIGNYSSSTGFTGSATTRTVSSIDFGPEAPDRYVLSFFAGRDDASSYTVSSATAGGNASTILVDSSGGASRSCAMALTHCPTGTTGQSIAVTFSEAVAFAQEVAWLVLYGCKGLEALSSNSASGVTTTTVDLAGMKARAGGLGAWCMFGFDGTAGGIDFSVTPSGIVDGSIVEITDQTASGGTFAAGFCLFDQDQDDVTMSAFQFHASPFHTLAALTLAAR